MHRPDNVTDIWHACDAACTGISASAIYWLHDSDSCIGQPDGWQLKAAHPAVPGLLLVEASSLVSTPEAPRERHGSAAVHAFVSILHQGRKDAVLRTASVQADLAAEEAAATEAALRKRGQNVDDMEASISRREAALGEAATQLEQRESALRSSQQSLEQQQAQLQATRLESKEVQVS